MGRKNWCRVPALHLKRPDRRGSAGSESPWRSSPDSPPFSPEWTRPGPFSPLQVVVAPSSRAGCPAASGPCRARHGCAWTPGSADGSHRVLAAMGLWPKRCVAGTPGSTSRARDRREAWVASCRTAAGSLRCFRGPGAVPSPRGSCLRSGTSPWPAGAFGVLSRARVATIGVTRQLPLGSGPSHRVRRCPRSPPVRTLV